MKRHPLLQDLSREHYAALKLALRAKNAAQSGAREAVAESTAACIAAFSAELEPHFVEEELTWLPLLKKQGNTDLVRRLEHDHGELRRLATELQHPAATTLLDFAERLTAHVRFEEREMFAVLENHFSQDGANAISDASSSRKLQR